LKVRDDEQSVMKSGRLFQTRSTVYHKHCKTSLCAADTLLWLHLNAETTTPDENAFLIALIK